MINYPESFPLDEVKSIIDTVRSRTVKENFKDFAHDIWVLQGFAQKSLIGDAAPDFSIVTQTAPEDFCAVDELEKLVTQAEGDGVSAQMSAPWQFILEWAINQLLEYLEGKLG